MRPLTAKVPPLLFWYKILFFFTATVMALPVRAQFDKLRNYNVKDGLPGSDVYNIMQDKKGYIWISGDMGVTRFDGYKFKNFSTQNGLSDNTVFGLYQDSKSRIWFRTFSGKLSYFLNDSIYTLACNDTISKYFQRHINNSIYVDEGDTLWLGGIYKCIYKVNPGWKKNGVTKIDIPGNGRYIFTIDQKGFLFGAHNDTISDITVFNKKLSPAFVIQQNFNPRATARFFVMKLKNGNYLASIDNHISVFNRNGIVQQKTEDATFIASFEDRDGTILSSTTNGIRIYRGGNIFNVRQIPQLNAKVITGACSDMENEYWFATEGQGIFSIPHRQFKYYTPENGISESKISSMGIVDSNVAIGHLDGTLTILSKNGIISLQVKTKNISPLVTRVFDIYHYKGKNFVGTPTNSYLIKHNLADQLFKDKAVTVRQFTGSHDGNLWTLHYSQIIKYDIITLKVLQKISLKIRTDYIFEDSRRTLWLAGMDGIYTIDSTGYNYLGSSNELFKNRAIAIKEDRDHAIWIATRGAGIILKKNNHILQLTEKDGLAGNMCRCICIDSTAVWVGTNKGLSKITKAHGKYYFENFYESNGLLTNEVNYILKHNNKLWLAHNNGLSVFDPGYVKDRRFSPPVYILQTLVNNKTETSASLGKLNYDQNYITINYTGLCFKDAGEVEYKYKMQGLDSVWTFTKYTSVKYQTLPAGNYQFIVYAKSNDGIWSSTPAFVTFTILPAWWQTWIFRTLAAVMLLAIIALIFRYRLTKVRARDSEKAKLQQRVAETELHALRAQMNPHFIFNAINSVQYFITRNDPESSQRYLAKFARLIRYVVDNSKPELIPLKTELDALNLYLELESLRFENKFSYKFIIDKDININTTFIPSMLIQPYVENAIWHGLMHKREAGTIIISLLKNENALTCIINDNGIGRKKSAEIKQRNPGSHKSLGLSLTKERLDIINQVNQTRLSVVISDLYNEHNEAAGTNVTINIPI